VAYDRLGLINTDRTRQTNLIGQISFRRHPHERLKDLLAHRKTRTLDPLIKGFRSTVKPHRSNQNISDEINLKSARSLWVAMSTHSILGTAPHSGILWRDLRKSFYWRTCENGNAIYDHKAERKLSYRSEEHTSE